jgi:hypothetical protein
MNRDTKSSAKRIPMSGSRDTTTLESPAGDEEATIVDNETKSIKGPPEKKRKFEVTEDDPLKRQIGDPFSSPEEADRKRPALDQHPTAPFEQPGSMQYQGTETFDTQAKGIFAPKNLDQESKVCVECAHRGSGLQYFALHISGSQISSDSLWDVVLDHAFLTNLHNFCRYFLESSAAEPRDISGGSSFCIQKPDSHGTKHVCNIIQSATCLGHASSTAATTTIATAPAFSSNG